jgi:hypothetical protein
MKQRRWGELRGALPIVLPGSIAALVVVRSLMAYWGRDWPASLIVLSIAAALALGLRELFARERRATQLERELRALPAVPDESTLEATTPLMAALLRARLEHTPPPSLNDGIAPFLTGLLVMLGLLGTLLGLFETVNGAGHALTSSADVDTLRRSLSAPIAGLTRSFGCSAAGISASAMLGLAIALVRRREARTLRAVHTYASGPLRVLSPGLRQARALEQLASQGGALPGAASAIEGVADKLGGLASQLVSLQQAALEAQQRAFAELLAGVHGELARAASETGQALHAHVSPLLEQMATRSGEALATQSAALAEVARNVTRELERDAARRRDDAAQALEAMRSRLDAAERARAAAHAEELATLTAELARTVTETERREQALSARWQELLTLGDAQLEAARSSERERLRSLDAQVSAAREREGEQLALIDDLSGRVGAELERLSGALTAQLEQRLASERDHDERAERAVLQLQAAADALERGIARQEGTLEQLVEGLPALFDRAAESSQESAERALAQLGELTEQRISGVSKLLSDELAERAARARVLDERALSAFQRVEQSAGVLDAAIVRQGSGLEGLIERVGTLLPQLTEAARTGAVDTLARLRELAEQQAERGSELEATLERGRAEHARGLAEQLSKHASELEQRLANTGAVVQEAAAIWQASSVEMQAVAELFASSAERQREAADSWLESLGEIEGAVERAGREAARDALADQLASTQELFARQLQFQRELFDQLRKLRGGTGRARIAKGEDDVSVGE